MDMYFNSYEGYFWQWEEQGGVLAIPGSVTIAYQPFLLEVLQVLSGQGLPPLGSVLLVIGATNNKGEKAVDDIYSLLEKRFPGGRERDCLQEAISFLKLLATVPDEYKTGGKRLLLIQTLFWNSHRTINVDRSKRILASFEIRDAGDLQVLPFYNEVFYNEFRVISLLNRRYPTVSSILEKMAGLPSIKAEMELPPPGDEPAPDMDFVQQLEADEKTFPVGVLIRHIWSGLNIPFHQDLPSQQPVGGVSDITNKGNIDRLLVSEYAHDDDVLLSRLANQEALYLNREVPPQHQQKKRVFLLDVSLRNWGSPKTLGFAFALAASCHPKAGSSSAVYAVGDNCQLLSLENVQEVINSLQVLSPGISCVKGLDQYFTELGKSEAQEIFFIASEEAYFHPELQRYLSEKLQHFTYWVHTGPKGSIDLYKRQQKGKRHLQHLELPVNELWRPKAKRLVSLHIPEENYPILFHPSLLDRQITTAPGEDIFAQSGQSLFRLFSSGTGDKKGWDLVATDLPGHGDQLVVGATAEKHFLVFVFTYSSRQVFFLNLGTQERCTSVLEGWDPSQEDLFVFVDSAFYSLSKEAWRDKCWKLTLENGIVSSSSGTADQHLRKRYQEAKENMQAKRQTFYVNRQVFKNINRVYINDQRNLVLNIHELRRTGQGNIKLVQTQFKHCLEQAEQVSANQFVFSDGSSVVVSREGMLILESSNKDIEKIYVPTCLDATLGLATASNFTGNGYFRKGLAQDFLSAGDFWKKWIDPFIQTIVPNGA